MSFSCSGLVDYFVGEERRRSLSLAHHLLVVLLTKPSCLRSVKSVAVCDGQGS